MSKKYGNKEQSRRNSGFVKGEKEECSEFDLSQLGELESAASARRAVEPRILLDAAAAETADMVADDVAAEQAAEWAKTVSQNEVENITFSDATRTQIAFIDSGVEDYQSLTAEIDPSIEIVLINADSDGVEQIAAHLDGKSDIDAIHIFSHGRSGTLDLGDTKLTAATMSGKHADEMQIIANSLRQNADILIYGCDFGAGLRGANAINVFVEATGADVATLTTDINFRDDRTPPSLDNNGDTSGTGHEDTYTEQGVSVPIVHSTVSITDPDMDILAIAISLNGLAGDQLYTDATILNPLGVSVSAPSGTSLTSDGVLNITLMAAAPLTNDQWETALQAISFVADTDTPERPVEVDRTVNIQLVDSNNQASPATTTIIHIDEINDIPFLSVDDTEILGNYSGTFTEDDGSIPITANTLVSDLDDTQIIEATIKLTNPQDHDQLIIDGVVVFNNSVVTQTTGTVNGLAYTVSINGADEVVITITDSGDHDAYEAALELIQFNNTSEDPDTTDRNFEFVMSDREAFSFTKTSVLEVISVNDPPKPIDPTDPTNPPTDPNDVMPAQTGVDSTALAPFDASIYFTDPDHSDNELTFTLDTTAPTWMSIDSNTGIITGTPPANASQDTNNGTPGSYDVLIIADDPAGGIGQTTAVYTITNPPPVAEDDAYGATDGINEDNAVSGLNIISDAGSGTDSDPDGDEPLTITQVNGEAANVGNPIAGDNGGLFTIASNGSLTFDPNGEFCDLAVGESETTAVTYQLSDGEGGFDSASVIITVAGANDEPYLVGAIPAQENTDGETVTPLDVTDYFDDPDGSNTLTFTIDPADLPDGLTFDGTKISGVVNPSASQLGTDPANAPGVYIIPVTVEDGFGGSITTDITYTITNPSPIALDDVGMMGEDEASISGNVITDATTGDNDTLPDSDDLMVSEINGDADLVGMSVEGSHGGSFIIHEDGSYEFEPGNDFQNLDDGESRDTFVEYQISDGEGGFDTATLTITITGSNDPPIVTGPTPAQNVEDGEVITPVDVTDVIDNPGNIDLTYSADNLPEGLVIDPTTGIISGTIDPDASVTGPYASVITATGPDGETLTTSILWNVTNPKPVAEDDATITPLDTQVVINVLGNDADGAPDSDVLEVSSIVTAPAFGIVEINDDGTLSYTPNTGFIGTDTLTYEVNDGQGGTDTAEVTIAVGGTPDGQTPTATDIPDETLEDGEVITPIDTGSAFSDPNGDPLTFAATGLPKGLVINPDTGEITGTLDPDASEDGPYTVHATATDPDGNQVIQSFVIAVTNPAPVAQDDAAQTPLDTPIILAPLANDSDPDGDALSIVMIEGQLVEPGDVVNVDNGSVTVNEDGTLTFTPDTGFSGTAIFDYVLEDGNGDRDNASITIEVDPSAPSPTIPTAGTLQPEDVIEGEVITPIAAGSVFTDPDGGQLTFTATDLPQGLEIDLITGEITGTPANDASEEGPYSVTITATDSDGNQVSTELVIGVSNPDPQAQDDNASTLPNTDVVINVTANDDDPDGDDLTVTAIDGTPVSSGDEIRVENGTVSVNPDGTLTFTPDGDYEGKAVFSYQVTDEQGATDKADVTIEITNNPTLPVSPIVPILQIDDGEDFTTTPLVDLSELGIGDPDGDTSLTITTTDPLPTGLTLNPDGTITGTVDNSASQGGDDPTKNPGVYTIEVEVNDGDLTTIIPLTIDVSNPVPVAVDDLVDQENLTGDNVNIKTADAFDDPDGDDLTFTATGLPTGLTINRATGVISGQVDPSAVIDSPNRDGVYEVTVTVDDGEGGTVSLTFIHTITKILMVVTEPTPTDPYPLPEQAAPEGPLPPELIVTKTANEIDPLGPNTGIFGNHPVIKALTEINPLGQGYNLDTDEHAITQVVSWIERSRDALANNSMFSEGDFADYVNFGSDALATNVGKGEIFLRTLGYGNRIFLEALGGNEVLEIEVESVDGRATPSWIGNDAENLLRIFKPADVEDINIVLNITNKDGITTNVEINLDLVGGIIGVIESRFATQGLQSQLLDLYEASSDELYTLFQKKS